MANILIEIVSAKLYFVKKNYFWLLPDTEFRKDVF